MEQPKKQLKMIWPQGRPEPPAGRLAEGFSLRTYQQGDEVPYVRLMQRAGFENWDHETALRSLARCLPEGLFFAIHAASGILAATAAAQYNPPEQHPFLGEMGWVAADPDHRGHGLGYAVCAAATRRLLREHFPLLYLNTDDYRLAAIRIYLNLGWVPYLHAPDMEGRWRAVCEALGCAFESTGFVRA